MGPQRRTTEPRDKNSKTYNVPKVMEGPPHGANLAHLGTSRYSNLSGRGDIGWCKTSSINGRQIRWQYYFCNKKGRKWIISVSIHACASKVWFIMQCSSVCLCSSPLSRQLKPRNTGFLVKGLVLGVVK